MLSAVSRRLSAARALWRQFGLNESGSVAAVLVAVPVIAGTVAIGIETGQRYRTKRQMQNAADAGALAGSVEKVNGRTGTITSAALYEVQRNGFTNGSNGVTVTVNTTPTGFGSTPGSVQVDVTKSSKFSLGAVLLNWMGRSNASFDMKASAVAGQTTTTSAPSSEGCIIALTPLAEQGISITSFNNFGSDCSIMSNGTATGTGTGDSSINMSSFNNATLASGDTNNPAEIWTPGSFAKSSYTHFTADATLCSNSGCTGTATGSIVDPYASLPTAFETDPSKTKLTPSGPVWGSVGNVYQAPSDNNVTLSPGQYGGGLTIQHKSNVYFTPGDYYIVDGHLIISSDNNVKCPNCTATNGVTFILTASSDPAKVGGVDITGEN